MTRLFHRNTSRVRRARVVRPAVFVRRAPLCPLVLRCRWIPAADGRGLVALWEAEEPRPQARRAQRSVRRTRRPRLARHPQPMRRAAAAVVTRAPVRRKD